MADDNRDVPLGEGTQQPGTNEYVRGMRTTGRGERGNSPIPSNTAKRQPGESNQTLNEGVQPDRVEQDLQPTERKTGGQRTEPGGSENSRTGTARSIDNAGIIDYEDDLN